MGTGYTRNDTGNNIADGNVINAADFDGEYDAIEAAFNSSTGHTHDGTSAEGAPIEVLGPSQDVVITASVLRPKTTNTVDLGTSSLKFKDGHFEGTVNVDGGLTPNQISVKSTDAGVSKGPQLDIFRESASPADNDALGHIDFSGEDDGDNKTVYASILATALDVTDGTEDGSLKFNTMIAGTDSTVMELSSGNVTLTSADAGASAGPVLDLYRNSASPAVGDELGRVQFTGENDAGVIHTFAQMYAKISDETSSGNTEDGQFSIDTIVNGTIRERIGLYENSAVINQDAQDLDFRVESSVNTATLYASGEHGVVGIGTANETAANNLHILGNNTTPSVHVLLQSDDTASATAKISMFARDGSNVNKVASIENSAGDLTIDAPGDIIFDADGAQLRFKDGGTEIGVISNSSNDLQIVSSVSDADMIFRGNDGGTPFNALTLDMSEAGAATFNNKVGIGTSSHYDANTKLTVAGRINTTNGTATGSMNFGGGTVVNVGSLTDHNLQLMTNNTTIMTIESSTGHVGISDTTPENKLTVVEDGTNVAVVKSRTSATNGRASYQIGNDADNWFMGIDGGNSDSFFIADNVSGSDRLVISGSGNVGIGISPENAYSSYTALEIGRSGSIYANENADDVNMGVNFYLASDGNWRAKNTEAGSLLQFNDGDFRFFTAPSTTADTNISWTEKVRIKNTGGITFNGDTSTANALDDYEEGTFTPSFQNAGGSVSYSQQNGYYTKVGDIVNFTLVVTCGNITSSNNGVDVSGLPFTAKDTGVYYAVPSFFMEYGFNATGAANGGFSGLVRNNDTVIGLYTQQASTGNNYAAILYSMLNTGSSSASVRIRISGAYHVA